jgi:hypothetical protein
MNKAAFSRQIINGTPCLVPMDDDGREMLTAMKPGKAVLAEIATPRNPRHHRLLFALFKKLYDAGVWEGDMNTLLDWIKFATGHVRTAVDHNGNTHYSPKSIAYESMDQTSFNRWFDRVIYIVTTRLVGDDDWEALRDEIIGMVDNGWGNA